MGEYAQEVMTARWVWEGVLDALGRPGFDVDLFNDAQTRGNVRARRHITFPDEDALDRRCWARGRGEVFWGNPPFECPTLGQTLRKASEQDWSFDQLVLLVPLRPHRVYWRPAWTSKLEVHLPAHAFEGEENTFPLPLALLYWGPFCVRVARGLRKLGTVVRDAPVDMTRSR